MKDSESNGSPASSPVLEFGNFRIDTARHLFLRGDGTPVPLTPRVFETLRFLAEHNNVVVDKERLMEAVWPDAIVEENNLAQAISKLRQVLGEKPGQHQFIMTVPGRGYRFVAPVTKLGTDVGFARSTTAPPPALPAASKRKPARMIAFAAAVLVIVVAAIFFYRQFSSRSTAPAPADKSIAVLPFANLSDDPANAYFSEGMKDEILTRLAKISALKVISSTSTQKFAGKPRDLRDIARQLGVTHLLEGNIQKSGDAVRVTVQLIHAPSDAHLWAETYDRKLEDLFQVETEVAQRIVRALAAKLSGAEKQALDARPTANIEAYYAYLQGRHSWNRRTPDGFRDAVAYLRRAIQLDPAYAQARAGLADALLFLGGDNLPARDAAMKEARTLLHQALTLDETLGDAHASLGLLAMNYDSNWTTAENEFRRAIELNPNYATAHHWYGEFLSYMGRFDDAFREMRRAVELDPLSLIIQTDLAKIHYHARQYDEAIAGFRAVLETDGDFSEARGLLGVTLSCQGHHDEGAAELRKIRNIDNNPMHLSWLGYVYGYAGRNEEGRRVLNRLMELSQHTYVSPFSMAAAWFGAGDHEQSIRSLEQTFNEPAAGGLLTFKVIPPLDHARSDPRFIELLRRANFPP